MKSKFSYVFTALAATFVFQAAQAEDLEVYGKAGIPGVGVGVGYGVSDNVTVRGDLTTLGNIKRDFHYRAFDFDAKLKTNKLNVHADYFPMEDNAFRLTTGLGFGKTSLEATGKSDSSSKQTFKLGGKTYEVNLTGNDTLDVEVKYPAVSPYFGIGWGHDVKRKKAGEWGFSADLGFYAGKPKTTVSINSDLRQKLVDSQGGTEAAVKELDSRLAQETEKVKDKVEKYKVIPVVNFGVTYHF
ncbi:outer membrane beta-barrel protein [Alysiella filiformis]|uniref:Uncharacterized protein n=1 Tax=Alysiella filiformis DSM 16848 TaxID=1120981 RepID=A0A286EQ02_9NEIS|nr:outer membrane beta-barrel protein [Alysiella filiformis]QMT31243.1 outer membrane beta-barrel protein [Alysiella filiformis]UBQ55756.1 outer membrane beta-barrel protein [Alysiella filiformis DSM 16848]SOD72889.1 hypothetical protein SAMN02746062_02245 [Alysiella filiformis DSM 16848]